MGSVAGAGGNEKFSPSNPCPLTGSAMPVPESGVSLRGFWSVLEPVVMGTLYELSSKYLPLYVAEFRFRYNNRENADIFGAAIGGC
jgi:hypothetical protein